MRGGGSEASFIHMNVVMAIQCPSRNVKEAVEYFILDFERKVCTGNINW